MLTSWFSPKIRSPKSYQLRFGFIFALALVLALFTQKSFAQTAMTAQITWAQDSERSGLHSVLRLVEQELYQFGECRQHDFLHAAKFVFADLLYCRYRLRQQ